MAQAVTEVGDKLLIITRRNYSGDLLRHFAGSVLAVSGGLVRVQGYAFVFNVRTLEYVRKPELRTRIFALSDAQLIVLVVPPAVVIEKLNYRKRSYDGGLILSDGAEFTLDLREFSDSS